MWALDCVLAGGGWWGLTLTPLPKLGVVGRELTGFFPFPRALTEIFSTATSKQYFRGENLGFRAQSLVSQFGYMVRG